MTRKLEELFNLPPAEADPTQTMQDEAEVTAALANIKQDQEFINEADVTIDKIDTALPLVKNLESTDKEMDEIADLAIEKFKDLMDLGMNCEARVAGPIFQSASTLLGNALAAKQAKIDKKLRMIDLQLKKARLDQQAKAGTPGEEAEEGNGRMLDRNELIKMLKEQKPAK